MALKYHMFGKLQIGDDDDCDCRTGKITAKHVLKVCPTFEVERK